jgi:hypothetical protein
MAATPAGGPGTPGTGAYADRSSLPIVTEAAPAVPCVKYTLSSLTDADPKHQLDLLAGATDESDVDIAVAAHAVYAPEAKHKVWVLDDLLTKRECQSIIDAAAPHAVDAKMPGRDSARVIAFDYRHQLEHRISARLQECGLIHMLNLPKNKVAPYGFDNVDWSPPTGEINPCFRISIYPEGSSGFTMHRDGAFTESPTTKSSMTLVVFLQGDSEGELLIYGGGAPGGGASVAEEAAAAAAAGVLKIPAETGSAVLFDQRLLHAAAPVADGKVVLRTDLICHGTLRDTPLSVDRSRRAAQNLFRCAQLIDLNNGEGAAEAYHRAIALRVTPTVVPTDACFKFLAGCESTISGLYGSKWLDVTKTLTFVDRTSDTFQFRHTASLGCEKTLRAAAVFVLTSRFLSAVPPEDDEFTEPTKEFRKCFRNVASFLGVLVRTAEPKTAEDWWDELVAECTGDEGDVLDTDSVCFDDISTNLFELFHDSPEETWNSRKTPFSTPREKDLFPLLNAEDAETLSPGAEPPFGIEVEVDVLTLEKEQCQCGLDGPGPESVAVTTRATELSIKFGKGRTFGHRRESSSPSRVRGTLRLFGAGTPPKVLAAFNHASCNCELKITIDDVERKRGATITFDLEYVMTATELTIRAPIRVVL